ncbi:MAG: phosphotransferase, partial [bacterium]
MATVRHTATTPYADLTPRAQVGRLRPVALEALKEFGLQAGHLRFIHHGENTTWRVELPRPLPGRVPEGCHPSRVLLRMHRATYNLPREIVGELTWLEALRRDTDLVVPVPLHKRDGSAPTTFDDPLLGGPRVITATRWITGRMAGKLRTAAQVEATGRLMAQLHDHAAHWRRPKGFVRCRYWDRGLMTAAGNPDRGDGDVWHLLPADARQLYRRVRDRMAVVLEDLGDGPDAVGLIHADLHLHNVVFHQGVARPIDFDDCQMGPWLYDLAVTLYSSTSVPEAREAVLRGYRRIRPFPEAQLRHLRVVMAARDAGVLMWLAVRGQTNTRYAGIFERNLPASIARCRQGGGCLWRFHRNRLR